MFELSGVRWQGRVEVASLRLEPGQRVALIGPNGAGKSSLLRLLAGQVRPDAGRIVLDGRLLWRWTAAEQARRRAWLPQQPEIGAPLSGAQLLSLGRLPGAAFDSVRYDEILSILELAPLLERPVPALSGGEQMRLQLGRVLIQAWAHRFDHSRALLLDEALSPLDIRYRMALLAALKRWCDSGELALVWCSHDLNEAMRHGTHAWLLANGALRAAGSTDAVMTQKWLTDAFGWPIVRLQTPEGPVLLARS